MIGYWFAREDGTTKHLKAPAVIGETHTVDGEIIPCARGLHASPTPWDALKYAKGTVLYEVEIPDDAIPHGDPVDKYAARSRTYLRKVNLERAMYQFAAQQALSELDKWPAPEVVREYIEGTARGEDKSDISGAALEAAFSAARSMAIDTARGEVSSATFSATFSAAWSAAIDAARDAARSAAWSAAIDAARDAARSAAWSAARDAAWSAAIDAARSAARSAAWSAAGDELNMMALAELDTAGDRLMTVPNPGTNVPKT